MFQQLLSAAGLCECSNLTGFGAGVSETGMETRRRGFGAVLKSLETDGDWCSSLVIMLSEILCFGHISFCAFDVYWKLQKHEISKIGKTRATRCHICGLSTVTSPYIMYLPGNAFVLTNLEMQYCLLQLGIFDTGAGTLTSTQFCRAAP